MPIITEKVEEWEKVVKRNSTDAYGKCCVDVARGVMKDLDKVDAFDCHAIICGQKEAKGLSGYQAGAVASMVSNFHTRGEEFRKQWNNDVGIRGGRGVDGVIDPSTITVRSKDNA